MLAFNVAQLLKEGVGATRHYQLTGELYDIDASNPGIVPIEGYLDLVRTPRGVLAQGRAALTLQATCRRCLAPFASAVTLEIEEEYVATIDVVTGLRLKLEADDEAELLINDHHTLDTSEVLRQLAVAATVAPGLCRPDCKGICPVCGADLNREACHCHLDRVDPRVAALAGLLHTPDDTPAAERK